MQLNNGQGSPYMLQSGKVKRLPKVVLRFFCELPRSSFAQQFVGFALISL